MLEELNNAKEFIYIEYFIVEKGLFFDSIYNILKQKVNEGVKVYFMFDDFGSILTFSNHTLIEMENNGINCCIFNPTITIKAAINNRDHRKMVIIDNKVCFSGGIDSSR
ncbi:MAG: phospholipase D-like domain-containing protein [Bacilli bacterium]